MKIFHHQITLIVDRFVEEFKINPQLITKKVEDADSSYFNLTRETSLKTIKEKKVICTIHHIDFDKFTGKEKENFTTR